MKHLNLSLTMFAALTASALTLISVPQLFDAKAMAFAPPADATTIVGTLSCAACRGTCPRKGETLYSCTLRNVRSGSPYVLVVGNQLYLLKGNTEGLDKFAGGKVAVKGHFEGSSIVAESVSDVRPVAKTESASKQQR